MSKTAPYNSKAEESRAEGSRISQDQDAPPTYTPDTANPPTYDSIVASVHENMLSLVTGDPSETISVPMISRMHNKSFHDMNPFSRKTGGITQTVKSREMTREFYLKHYVKDSDGNFIGTASQAPDAGLVFVPGKSTPEDLMRQVNEVGFGKQQIRGGGMGKLGTRIREV
ncbi:hypothetical protein BKA63DRAFT_136614 [Paraphoma chrysanthemicola]|nr:hypothetical protein BKA63DRAFT_136614 [Paraphoma chrysanthemicola]